MLRGEERKSDRNRRGKVLSTQGTIATASLCRSGGRDGVREKTESAWKEKGKKSTSSHRPPSFVCPQKFCINSLSSISLGDDCNTQLLCKRWGHWIRCIMGDVQMATNSSPFLSAGASADSKIWFCQLIARWVSGLRQGLGKRRGEGRGPSLFPLFAPYFSKSWY